MNLRTLEPIISEHDFFKGLPPDIIALLVGCAANARFQADEFLCQVGGEARQFHLIRQGQVALEFFVPHRGPTTIEMLGPGDILGWSWLFPPYRWQFDARAVTLTRTIAFDGLCLRGKCEENHTLGHEFMKRFAAVLTQRLQATRLQLLDVYSKE